VWRRNETAEKMVAMAAVMETAELVQPWLLREEEDGCGGDYENGAGTVVVVLSLLVHRIADLALQRLVARWWRREKKMVAPR